MVLTSSSAFLSWKQCAHCLKYKATHKKFLYKLDYPDCSTDSSAPQTPFFSSYANLTASLAFLGSLSILKPALLLEKLNLTQILYRHRLGRLLQEWIARLCSQYRARGGERFWRDGKGRLGLYDIVPYRLNERSIPAYVLIEEVLLESAVCTKKLQDPEFEIQNHDPILFTLLLLDILVPKREEEEIELNIESGVPCLIAVRCFLHFTREISRAYNHVWKKQERFCYSKMQWSNLLLVEEVWARERFKSMLQAEEFTISDLSLDMMGRFAIGKRKQRRSESSYARDSTKTLLSH